VWPSCAISQASLWKRPRNCCTSAHARKARLGDGKGVDAIAVEHEARQMTPERWAHIREILEAVLDQPPERRSALLDSACADDPDSRARVEANAGSAKKPRRPAVRDSQNPVPPRSFRPPISAPPESASAARRGSSAGRCWRCRQPGNRSGTVPCRASEPPLETKLQRELHHSVPPPPLVPPPPVLIAAVVRYPAAVSWELRSSRVKFGWFKMLNTSYRDWNLFRSVTAQFLASDRSIFISPGPSRMPRPELPGEKGRKPY